MVLRRNQSHGVATGATGTGVTGPTGAIERNPEPLVRLVPLVLPALIE